MGKALSQLWLMVTSFFSAGEAIANTMLNLAKVAEDKSSVYRKEESIIDSKRLKALEAE